MSRESSTCSTGNSIGFFSRIPSTLTKSHTPSWANKGLGSKPNKQQREATSFVNAIQALTKALTRLYFGSHTSHDSIQMKAQLNRKCQNRLSSTTPLIIMNLNGVTAVSENQLGTNNERISATIAEILTQNI